LSGVGVLQQLYGAHALSQALQDSSAIITVEWSGETKVHYMVCTVIGSINIGSYNSPEMFIPYSI